ncbi:MAG: MFS transporter [Erysipelotrichaceae bacterium]|nr:MFS transporter [Erysipelotrichaceae bacterium]
MNNKINTKYILIQVFYQAIASVAWGFGIYSLMARGFDSGQAGLCMAFSNVVSLVLQPAASNYIDNSKKHTVFEVLVLEALIMMVLFIANCYIHSAGLMLATVFIFAFGIYSAVEPLINTISSKFAGAGIEIEYSKARSAGSLSYAVMCIIFGRLTVIYPYTVVLYGALLFAVSLILTIILIRKDYGEVKDREVKKIKEKDISYLEFIKNNKNFMVLCLFATGIFFGYTCIDNFMLLVTEEVGGNSGDMGSILGFKAVVEGIAIFFFVKLRKKISLEWMLKICAIAFLLKSIATSLSPNVFALYVTQLLQMASFAFYMPSMVEYVNTYLNPKEVTRGQAMITMTLIFATMFSSSIGGNVANIFGTKSMEWLATFVTLFASAGFYLTVKSLFKNKRTS